LPRAFCALEGFSRLPPLGMNLFGCYNILGAGVLTKAPLSDAFRAYARAAQIVADGMDRAASNEARMAAVGIPPGFVVGPIIEAPFDLMSDTLRGMRGIMLGHAAARKAAGRRGKGMPFQLKFAIDVCRAPELMVFIPLHRGSDISFPRSIRWFYWLTQEDDAHAGGKRHRPTVF
jgi:hypothetical protein